MRVQRFDRGTLRKPKRLPSGVLRVDSFLTRTGVFLYRNADGTIRRELRHPEEVFSEDSLDTLRGGALTMGHPDQPVSLDNAKELAVGVVGTDLRRDGDAVRSMLSVTDKKAVGQVESGTQELSCGYWADYDDTPGVTNGIPGVPDGLHYDGVQRNIEYNHAAFVDRGRAGPSIRARVDAATWRCDDVGWVVDSDESEETLDVSRDDQQDSDTVAPKAPGEATMKFKITIDGVTFELEGNESAQQALTQKLDKDAAKITSEAARADTAEEKLATAEKSHAEAISKEKARADTAEEKVESLEKARDDAASPETIEKAVAARMSLVETARKVIGDEFKADGKSADDIKREVVLKVSPSAAEKLDANDATYLQARFDQAVEGIGRQSNADVRADAEDLPASGDAKYGSKLDEAQKKFRKRSDSMWERPLSASKDAKPENVTVRQ